MGCVARMMHARSSAAGAALATCGASADLSSGGRGLTVRAGATHAAGLAAKRDEGRAGRRRIGATERRPDTFWRGARIASRMTQIRWGDALSGRPEGGG